MALNNSSAEVRVRGNHTLKPLGEGVGRPQLSSDSSDTLLKDYTYMRQEARTRVVKDPQRMLAVAKQL